MKKDLITPRRFTTLFSLKEKNEIVAVGTDEKNFAIRQGTDPDAYEYFRITETKFKEYVKKALKEGVINEYDYEDYYSDASLGASAFQGVNDMCKEKVESFEIITIGESGMRHSIVYEVVYGGKTTLSLYRGLYHKEGDRELERSVDLDNEEFIALLNKCNVMAWNGFHGKHPRGVLDGTMFKLKGVVNGKEIYADGSQNFPRGYNDLIGYFYKKLRY